MQRFSLWGSEAGQLELAPIVLPIRIYPFGGAALQQILIVLAPSPRAAIQKARPTSGNAESTFWQPASMISFRPPPIGGLLRRIVTLFYNRVCYIPTKLSVKNPARCHSLRWQSLRILRAGDVMESSIKKASALVLLVFCVFASVSLAQRYGEWTEWSSTSESTVEYRYQISSLHGMTVQFRNLNKQDVSIDYAILLKGVDTPSRGSTSIKADGISSVSVNSDNGKGQIPTQVSVTKK
jgi:hypothetical protein